ncbi:unnamed protein product, partial [Ectocarpus sp. 13 AM-2016]
MAERAAMSRIDWHLWTACARAHLMIPSSQRHTFFPMDPDITQRWIHVLAGEAHASGNVGCHGNIRRRRSPRDCPHRCGPTPWCNCFGEAQGSACSKFLPLGRASGESQGAPRPKCRPACVGKRWRRGGPVAWSVAASGERSWRAWPSRCNNDYCDHRGSFHHAAVEHSLPRHSARRSISTIIESEATAQPCARVVI